MLAGYNVNQSVLIMTTIALVVAFVGVGGLQLGVPERVMFYVFLGLFAVYFWGMMHAWRVMKAIRTRGPVPSSPSGPF